MAWLSQNWIYLTLIAAAVFFLWRERAPGRLRLRRDRRPEMQIPIDPVSGEPVPSDVSIAAAYEGRTYYFASPQNRMRFEAAPHRYAPAEERCSHCRPDRKVS